MSGMTDRTGRSDGGALFTGKSVEEAVADGLRSLGLTQDEVEVEILNRGSRGLFGIGSEPAQVRITPRRVPPHPPAPAEPAPPALEPAAEAETETSPDADEAEMADLAVELLSETVRHMGFEAEVVASWQEPDADNDERYLLLNLHGRDLGALIGRRGETLGNLQYLLRLMVNQRLHQWKNIVVDVEQYRQRRAEHLVQLALRSADQVAKTGRALSLEPMPPNERRIIHLALRDHASVFTESSGEGERRKIQILPRRGAPGVQTPG